MKQQRHTIQPPKPVRKQRPGLDDEAESFCERIRREGGGEWFSSRAGQVIGALWYRELDKEEAQEWLDRKDDDHQRNCASAKVEQYAGEMDAGDFRHGIPMLIFDYRGRLINGQHILSGFLRSSAETIVVSVQINLHDKAYQAIDENKKRTLKDTFKWNGVDRPTEVASIVTVLHQYLAGCYDDRGYLGARNGKALATNAQGEKVRKQFPEIEQHLWKDPGTGGYSLPALRAASVILAQIDPDHHKKFFAVLIEGLHIDSPKDPVAVLRTAVLKARKSANGRGGWRHGETILRVFKAWNHSIRGESITGPLYRKGEPFQPPLGRLPVPESTRASRRLQ